MSTHPPTFKKDPPLDTQEKSINPLNDTWGSGLITTITKENWIIEKKNTFDNVNDMWKTINYVFYKEIDGLHTLTYDPTQTNHFDVWFFRFPHEPHWDTIKKTTGVSTIYELRVNGITASFAIRILLSLIGETLSFSLHVIGIRIKPSKFGGDIRMWIADEFGINRIKKDVELIWSEETDVKPNIIITSF